MLKNNRIAAQDTHTLKKCDASPVGSPPPPAPLLRATSPAATVANQQSAAVAAAASPINPTTSELIASKIVHHSVDVVPAQQQQQQEQQTNNRLEQQQAPNIASSVRRRHQTTSPSPSSLVRIHAGRPGPHAATTLTLSWRCRHFGVPLPLQWLSSSKPLPPPPTETTDAQQQTAQDRAPGAFALRIAPEAVTAQLPTTQPVAALCKHRHSRRRC